MKTPTLKIEKLKEIVYSELFNFLNRKLLKDCIKINFKYFEDIIDELVQSWYNSNEWDKVEYYALKYNAVDYARKLSEDVIDEMVRGVVGYLDDFIYYLKFNQDGDENEP